MNSINLTNTDFFHTGQNYVIINSNDDTNMNLFMYLLCAINVGIVQQIKKIRFQIANPCEFQTDGEEDEID